LILAGILPTADEQQIPPPAEAVVVMTTLPYPNIFVLHDCNGRELPTEELIADC